MPERYGLARVSRGGAAGRHAGRERRDRARRAGAATGGPQTDIVLLNAAYALLASDEFDGLDDCLEAARESVASGAALGKLDALVEASNEIAEAA